MRRGGPGGAGATQGAWPTKPWLAFSRFSYPVYRASSLHIFAEAPFGRARQMRLLLAALLLLLAATVQAAHWDVTQVPHAGAELGRADSSMDPPCALAWAFCAPLSWP